MKHTNIFSRWMCLAMLLGCVGVSWGQTWTKLTDVGSLSSGNYQIQNDNLDIKKTIIIESGRTVTIDLNGYVLRGLEIPYVIHVKSGGKLTIKDSNPGLGHKGRVNIETGLWSWADADAEHVQQNISGGIIYNAQQQDKDSRGIFVEGECIIEYAKILGCYSKTHGAAVYVDKTGTFVMNGGQISYNYAENYGGAIFGYNISLKNCSLTNNIAGYRGGAIYNDVLLDDSSIKKVPKYTLQIDGCTIDYNYAGIDGGGIYSKTTTNINDSYIRYNYAMTSEIKDNEKQDDGRGGGFYFVGSGIESDTNNDGDEDLYEALEPIIEFTLSNTLVAYNKAMYYGGGGQVCSGAKLIMKTDAKVNENEVILHGAGGLHLTSSAFLVLNQGAQINSNTAQYCGGAIHSSYNCGISLLGGEISGNKVYGRGGGVHVNTGGDLQLSGTNITDNYAYVGKEYQYATITRQTKLVGAKATLDVTVDRDENGNERDMTGYGGGVFVDSSICTMNMSQGLLSGNFADKGGGGIALAMINMPENDRIQQVRVVNFTLMNGSVNDNETQGNGGGIYIMKNESKADFLAKHGMESEDDLTNNDIYNKYKDYIDKIFNGIPTATIAGGLLTNNEATGNGGALLVNGNVTMTNGTFSKNEANNGGGICIIGGTVSITQGNIIENIATNYGGGVYVENTDPSAEITLEGEGVFEKNTAKAGGGMAVNGPFTFNFADTLQNNNAVNGGGIYLLKGTSTTKGATLHFNGGFIRNNTATGTPKLTGQSAYQKDVDAVAGVGGGVFMADYTTLDFNVTDNTLGFYGNRATNAADDIFANGNGTSVTLPDVKDMTLIDFSVPADNLFWAEDFYSHYENNAYESDSQYATLLSEEPSFTDPAHNLRYQFALQNLKKNHVIEVSAQNIKDRYVCLVLGYEIFYITIKKKGLKEGESAMFDISTTKSGVPNPYISMLLTGNENGEVCKRVALPQGTWTVSEKTKWGWSYTPEGETSIEKEVSADNIVFGFTNEKNVTETLHDEAIIPNTMGTSSSSNTDKSK